MNNYSNSRQYGRDGKRPGEAKKIFLFYVLPFILVNAAILFLVITKPKFTITVADTNDYLTTSVTIKIKSFLPIKSMSVKLDDNDIELEEGKGKTYTATVSTNGILELKLESINGMKNVGYEHINVLDDNPPSVADYFQDGDLITIKLDDSQSGIDFTSIYAIEASDQHQEPLSVDKAAKTATFIMLDDTMDILVMDMAGNEGRTTFSSVDGSIESMGAGAAGQEESSTLNTAEESTEAE